MLTAARHGGGRSVGVLHCQIDLNGDKQTVSVSLCPSVSVSVSVSSPLSLCLSLIWLPGGTPRDRACRSCSYQTLASASVRPDEPDSPPSVRHGKEKKNRKGIETSYLNFVFEQLAEH